MGSARTHSRARVLVGVAACLAFAALIGLPAAAITPPTDPDPAPGAVFAIQSTVPAVITTPYLLVSGTAGPADTVTVEAVGAGNDSCVTNVTPEGEWACAIQILDQGAVTIQAYREGGLYLEDYDERSAIAMLPPAFDAGASLTWNGSDYQQISGTRYSFNEIHVLVDGAEGPCFIDFPAGSPTTWSCTMTTPLTDGTYTITAYQKSLAFTPAASSAAVTLTLTVDTTAPDMARVDYPVPAGPWVPEVLETTQTTDHHPTFEGTAEPGATVTVRYQSGGWTPYWDSSTPELCSAVADSAGDWSCTSPVWFSTGDVYSFGAEQTDAAGNTTSGPFQQFALEFIAGPVTPTISSPVTGYTTFNSAVTLSGTGAYGDFIYVYLDGEYNVCFTAVEIDGTWSCTTDALPLGTHALQVQASSNDAYSGTDEISVTIVSPPPPPNPPVATPPNPPAATPPSNTPQAITWDYSLTDQDGNPISSDQFTPGSTIVITSNGLPAGSTANATLHSDPINLGSAVVSSDGTLKLPVTIPTDAPLGTHELIVTLTPPGGVPSPAVRAVSVAAASSEDPGEIETVTGGSEPSASPTAEPTTASAPISAPTRSKTDASAPSTISSTLQTLGDLRLTPVDVAVATSVALAFILLVALPAELMQSTIAANYRRAFGWLEPLRARARAITHRVPPEFRSGRLGGLVSVAATALILSLADPSFGFNGMSLRLFLGIFGSLYIVNVAVVGIIRRRALRLFGVASRIDPMPASLLIVAVSVLVSRIAHIQPGFLFGLVVGVAFGRELAKVEEGRIALWGSWLMIGLGLGSWLIFSVLPSSDGVLLNLVRDIAAATALESLGTMLVAMLPFAFLEGQGLFKWSRWRWAAMYGLSVLVFVLVVVPMSGTWGQLSTPFLQWLALFSGFAVVALGVWTVFRLTRKEEHVHHDELV